MMLRALISVRDLLIVWDLRGVPLSGAIATVLDRRLDAIRGRS